jgi:phytoene dehydrogenase-like protein
MPLECVRGTAGFEGPAAKDARAGTAHVMCGSDQLKLGFHRARPGHGDEITAADLCIQHGYDSLIAPRTLQSIR